MFYPSDPSNGFTRPRRIQLQMTLDVREWVMQRRQTVALFQFSGQTMTTQEFTLESPQNICLNHFI